MDFYEDSLTSQEITDPDMPLSMSNSLTMNSSIVVPSSISDSQDVTAGLIVNESTVDTSIGTAGSLPIQVVNTNSLPEMAVMRESSLVSLTVDVSTPSPTLNNLQTQQILTGHEAYINANNNNSKLKSKSKTVEVPTPYVVSSNSTKQGQQMTLNKGDSYENSDSTKATSKNKSSSISTAHKQIPCVVLQKLTPQQVQEILTSHNADLNKEINNDKAYPKPKLSYKNMIILALNKSPTRSLKVDEIFNFIMKKFPYYSNRTRINWKNCVRHTLSHNKIFQKLEIPAGRRDHLWSMNPLYGKKYIRDDIILDRKLQNQNNKNSAGVDNSITNSDCLELAKNVDSKHTDNKMSQNSSEIEIDKCSVQSLTITSSNDLKSHYFPTSSDSYLQELTFQEEPSEMIFDEKLSNCDSFPKMTGMLSLDELQRLTSEEPLFIPYTKLKNNSEYSILDTCEKEYTPHKYQSLSDNQMLSRAWSSLPSNLYVQHIKNDKNGKPVYGVYAKEIIDEHIHLGPVKGVLVKREDMPITNFTLLIDENGVSKYLDTSDEAKSNWMRFVRPADSLKEQNLAVVQQDQSLFFKSTCFILPETELRIWYSPTYAEKFGLPLLEPNGEKKFMKEHKNILSCFKCNQRFSTSMTLKKHLIQHDGVEGYIPVIKHKAKVAKVKAKVDKKQQFAKLKDKAEKGISNKSNLIAKSDQKNDEPEICEKSKSSKRGRKRKVEENHSIEVQNTTLNNITSKKAKLARVVVNESNSEKVPKDLGTKRKVIAGQTVKKLKSLDNDPLNQPKYLKRGKKQKNEKSNAVDCSSINDIISTEASTEKATAVVNNENNQGVPKGWLRKVLVRKTGKTAGQLDIYIYSPDGLKFRSRPEILSYLKRTKSDLKLEDFNFSKKLLSSEESHNFSPKKLPGKKRGCPPTSTKKGCPPTSTKKGCPPTSTKKGCPPTSTKKF